MMVSCSRGLVLLALATGCVFDSSGVALQQDVRAPDAWTFAERPAADALLWADARQDRPGAQDGPARDATPASDTAPDTPAKDAAPPKDTGPVYDPPWWNPAYAHRRRLTISETAAGSLPAGYSVVVAGFNSQSLVSAGQAKAGGDDLRVIYWSGSASVELDRRLLGMNTTSTQVWFKTQAAVTVTSTDYFLYYGNPSAGAAPAYWSDSMSADAPSRVYLAADDFQEHSQGDCPDGWGSCGTQWLVEASGSERYFVTQKPTNGQYLFAGSSSWTDVVAEARVRSDDPAGCPGIATRVEDTQNLVYAGYNCGASSLPANNVAVWPRVNNNYSTLIYQAIAAPTGWHTIRLAWKSRDVSLYHDGAFMKKGTAPTAVDLAGRVGLFSTYATKLYADDFIVRLFVDPEPTVSAGSEETHRP